jgi:hypothetical protein
MDYNDIIELMQRGVFTSFGEHVRDGVAGNKRNAVALLMLHAAASAYPVDAPRCIEMAFKLADAYIRKAAEPAVDPLAEPSEPVPNPKILKLLQVLAAWPCPVCGGENGGHDNTCGLGAAIESL